MNNTIRLGDKPCRIISLVPSQTELLSSLGLDIEVVGISKFCIHPKKWFQSKERIGGTKSVNIEHVRSLNPDLIIGNKEENSIEDINQLKEIAPVWMSDIYTVDDSIEMINSIAEITGKSLEGNLLIDQIKSSFKKLEEFISSVDFSGKSALYFIWDEPSMVAGRKTFIDNLLEKCGFSNATSIERYPVVEELVSPDFVFLSSEPFPFKEKHISIYQQAYPNSKIVLVDGEMFSWYGSRLKSAPDYFIKLIKSLLN